MKIQNLVLIAGLTAVAAFVGYDYFTNSPARLRTTESAVSPSTGDASGRTSFAPTGLAAQTSNEGQVEVTVTPSVSNNGKTWDFIVSLNTHSVELTEDMMQSAVLDDGDGNWLKPIAWSGAPPGGHHREGVLYFGPVSPRLSAIKLEVRGVGGVGARTFSWLIP